MLMNISQIFIIRLYHVLPEMVKILGDNSDEPEQKQADPLPKCYNACMDIHQLRVFVSVFKERSFSRASSAINLTQPTISHHIRILEEELACKLLDRLGRTIIPTKEADVLYGYAMEVLEKIEALKDAFSR